MALPGNWNSSSVRVDPWVLNASANNLKTAVQNIQDDLEAIMKALGDLKISWTGDSAAAAAEADRRWNGVMTDLYGPPKNPQKGILGVLTSGVASSAVNYSQCEGHVYDMFAHFESAMEAPSNGSSSDQKNVIDDSADGSTRPPYHTTSVNEKF